MPPSEFTFIDSFHMASPRPAAVRVQALRASLTQAPGDVRECDVVKYKLELLVQLGLLLQGAPARKVRQQRMQSSCSMRLSAKAVQHYSIASLATHRCSDAFDSQLHVVELCIKLLALGVRPPHWCRHTLSTIAARSRSSGSAGISAILLNPAEPVRLPDPRLVAEHAASLLYAHAPAASADNDASLSTRSIERT